jgi:predicted nucleic acid-binding protein
MHLDTCFLIDLQKERRDKREGVAHGFLRSHGSERMEISPVVAMEYLEGFPDDRIGKALRFLNAFAWVEIGRPTVVRASRLRRRLRQSGNLIPDADIVIAAGAMEADAALVTQNTDHFSRIEGLRLIDYRRSGQ